MEEYLNLFKDKRILVTGGTGSIGSEIVRQLLKYNPKQIRILSRDEHKQFLLQEEFENFPVGLISFLLGDVRDKERVMMAMEGIDIVFHAAALKHVPFCEYNPFEAIKTNVFGTQNVVESARHYNIDRLIGISTDKAASPINTMGATKLLAEKIIMSAEEYKGLRKTLFCAVRFGNVIGSRGSVIPLFVKQAIENNEICVTDPEMVRFFMSIPQAVNLLFKSAYLTKGGGLFILKMPVIRLMDLAECIADILDEKKLINRNKLRIKIIGKRKGEKSYETLISEEEADNIYENSEMFYLQYIENSPIPDGFEKSDIKHYKSSDLNILNKQEIRNLIVNYLNDLINTKKYIEN